MKTIEIAAARKRELDLLRPISAEQEARIWQKFRFDWNYHSNNIEGNSLTFGETKSLLLHNITAQGKPLKDHIEITGHNEAINSLTTITSGNEPLTESFIRNLHLLILREPYLSKAKTEEGVATTKMIEVGKYKATANHVVTSTGETFRFAEPLDVPEKMHALVQFINNAADKSAAQSIIEAAKVHYDFVMIHPFDDGNGRLARILMNLVFIKNGFPPAIIKTEDKANYYAALRQADGGQFEVFADYIASCLVASLNIMLAGARGESIEEPDEQDKQIKMLQRMLESKSGRLDVVRTTESMQETCTKSFLPLMQKLEVAAGKFFSMYIQSDTLIFLNDVHQRATGTRKFEIGDLVHQINTNTLNLEFQIKFQHLKFNGVDNFFHYANLMLRFNPGSYAFTSSFMAQPLSKSYGVFLTESEINAVVKEMTAQHIHVIEQASGIQLDNL
jgi:Fic family protein